MFNTGVRILFTLFLCFYLFAGCQPGGELNWQKEEGYRWAELQTGYWGETGFRKISASKTNIHFSNDVTQELKESNRNYLNGSGVTVADINGNGLIDVYFASLDGPNKLYQNLGNLRFKDITDEADVAHDGFSSTGVVFADINGNGFPDLLTTSLSEGNSIYINDGNGRFTLKDDTGLGESRGSKSMALADITGNGLPDLYIVNYNTITARDIYGPDELAPENIIQQLNGEVTIREPFDQYYMITEADDGPFLNEIGTSDELYINMGDGKFEKADISQIFFNEAGIAFEELPKDWGLTATFRDVTGNGLPDLYVANDFWTPDRFWINQEDGTFKLLGREGIRNFSYSSMGVDFSDINRNGLTDIVVTEMLSQEHEMRMRQFSQIMTGYEGRNMYNRNSVYLNRGDQPEGGHGSTFAQIAYYTGLEASEWSWATSFIDIDLDGYEDLIVTNGFPNDYQDMDTQIAMFEYDSGLTPGTGDVMDYPRLKTQNKIFRNNGDLTFSDVSDEWGFNSEDVSHGMALADLNNNGLLDVIINHMDEPASVFENRSKAPRIAVRLRGNTPNTEGIGAKIILEGGPVLQSKEIFAGGNYLSGSQKQVMFAADKENENHTITVKWPGGGVSAIENVKANRIYEIDESSASVGDNSESTTVKKKPSPRLFEDISDRLNHHHHENEYDDFRFSPLLPVKLSRLGPGVAWFDFTGEGNEELFITSGKDGETAIFSNSGTESFQPITLDPVTNQAPGDQTAVIGWLEDDTAKIVIGSANYEQGNSGVPSAYIYTVENQEVVGIQEIPGILSATGPIAAADYTGNGYPDLFIGGRHKPGQYPVSADSRLFMNLDGRFVLDEQNSALLRETGLVTDAIFADVTGNGNQNLLLSTEWGTLRLFEHSNGRFVEITRQQGLSGYRGWWNSVSVGDFTNNGLPDIIAVNMGRNSPYQIRNERPLRMYYDDFNWDGRLNILETHYIESLGGYVPMRKLHDFASVPTILQHVSTHREFAVSTIEQIFGQSFANVPFKEINTLEHMIFINTGDGFKAKPLPAEAQFSTGFSALVADFDNDGNEDLFMAQNFFALPKHIPVQDAGRGLILLGDGKGNFKPLTASESGIKIPGEQRGAVLADINQNGKTDLLVTQNSDRTKLFQNRTDKQGIRVTLNGPAGNRSAVGSSIRIRYQDGSFGPRRMVQTASGYWSQSSFTQVMGYQDEPAQIEIKWFDGTIKNIPFETENLNYVISY
ncbi:VCBS repeat-containing protein [soil metagenome]